MKIRRALLTVSDKSQLVELGQALARSGAELVATGKTAQVLKDAGLMVVPIEKITGTPEALGGRMKTLSFQVCAGILYRRGRPEDQADLDRLGISPVDCVVVNFYPFESASARPGITRAELTEEIDIGGPTLVRAAAKNSPDVLVLTDPAQYAAVIDELGRSGQVSEATANDCAATAWERVLAYDQAIAENFGARSVRKLRYGENPHQSGRLVHLNTSPIEWGQTLTAQELSYNNILDLSSAYALASDLIELGRASQGGTGVVIVKHNNPCGVAWVPSTGAAAQLRALELAWAGDPVSAFGGVLVFTHAIEPGTAAWLSERFVELVGAPDLGAQSEALQTILSKRKGLKAVRIREFGRVPAELKVTVPGGTLIQASDTGLERDKMESVTARPFPSDQMGLARFGIAACRTLKSNAVTLVRKVARDGALQLVGAGQGQPNRIDAIERLCVPRARAVLEASAAQGDGGKIEDCVLVSDAFFPFRDAVDSAHQAGIRAIIQPGGSIKDKDSIAACNEHGIAMAFTGTRHFKH